jgi:hypothetical protein
LDLFGRRSAIAIPSGFKPQNGLLAAKLPVKTLGLEAARGSGDQIALCNAQAFPAHHAPRLPSP